MIKWTLAPLSLVSQIALLMLLLGLLGIASMSVASWMAQSIQGNAHAINKAGSLRMQSYRLLASVPLTPASNVYLRQMEQDQDSADLLRAVQGEKLQPEFDALRGYWMTTLKDQIKQAQRPSQVADNVAVYVQQLDKLVAALEHKTEYHLMLISLVQRGLLVVTLLLLGLTIWFLRRRLLEPWQRLLKQANAVSAGDFSQRYVQKHHSATQNAPRAHNEMDILGQSLNSMSLALEQMVDSLAQLVNTKTADLQQKNQVLDFLYRVSRQLHTSAPLEQRLVPVLEELQTLTPLQSVQLRLYENNSAELFNDIASPQPATNPPDVPKNAPLHLGGEYPAKDTETAGQPVSWSLQDERENYGVLLAQLPRGETLNNDQQQLLATLLEQLTSSLTVARQAEHQQQLMLMEERSAIARELHDSLAQSLSCMKIQIACLQMQGSDLSEDNRQLIQQIRDEMNTAYRQLRELLTTFRLQMNTPGLRAALQHTVDEFSGRMGMAIAFNYALPPRSVPANQAIHLLHIAREALNNIFKHANATAVSLELRCEADEILMQVTDNGQGIAENLERQHHYGLIIMQDRAKSLHGQCHIARRASGGTRVSVRFRPDVLPVNPQEQV